MEGLFTPPDVPWQRVSPKLAVARRLGLVPPLAVLLALLVGAWVLLPVPGWAVTLGVAGWLALAVWLWWLVGQAVARWGYAEQGEELWITRGTVVRTLVVVPYGRMQYVDVQSGPLDRWLGIAQVHLHTASPGTTAVIPGLPAGEAARLRDRLTALGESEAAGL